MFYGIAIFVLTPVFLTVGILLNIATIYLYVKWADVHVMIRILAVIQSVLQMIQLCGLTISRMVFLSTASSHFTLSEVHGCSILSVAVFALDSSISINFMIIQVFRMYKVFKKESVEQVQPRLRNQIIAWLSFTIIMTIIHASIGSMNASNFVGSLACSKPNQPYTFSQNNFLFGLIPSTYNMVSLISNMILVSWLTLNDRSNRSGLGSSARNHSRSHKRASQLTLMHLTAGLVYLPMMLGAHNLVSGSPLTNWDQAAMIGLYLTLVHGLSTPLAYIWSSIRIRDIFLYYVFEALWRAKLVKEDKRKQRPKTERELVQEMALQERAKRQAKAPTISVILEDADPPNLDSTANDTNDEHLPQAEVYPGPKEEAPTDEFTNQVSFFLLQVKSFATRNDPTTRIAGCQPLDLSGPIPDHGTAWQSSLAHYEQEDTVQDHAHKDDTDSDGPKDKNPTAISQQVDECSDKQFKEIASAENGQPSYQPDQHESVSMSVTLPGQSENEVLERNDS